MSQEGKAVLGSGCVQLLTMTEDVVERWKEQFVELLSPTSTSSVEGTELEDLAGQVGGPLF